MGDAGHVFGSDPLHRAARRPPSGLARPRCAVVPAAKCAPRSPGVCIELIRDYRRAFAAAARKRRDRPYRVGGAAPRQYRRAASRQAPRRRLDANDLMTIIGTASERVLGGAAPDVDARLIFLHYSFLDEEWGSGGTGELPSGVVV